MLRPGLFSVAGLDAPTWPRVDTRDTRRSRVRAVSPFSHSLPRRTRAALNHVASSFSAVRCDETGGPPADDPEPGAETGDGCRKGSA